MLMYGRDQHNIAKQSSSNKKFKNVFSDMYIHNAQCWHASFEK